MQTIQQQVNELKARNKRVENDKARETSRARKIIIAVLTYAVIVVFLYTTKFPRPRTNAIVPTLGFMLSTLGLTAIKNIWLKHRK